MESILQILRCMVPNEDFEIVDVQEREGMAVCIVRYVAISKMLFITVFLNEQDGLLTMSTIDVTDHPAVLLPRACVFLNQAPSDLMGNTIGKVYVYIDDGRLTIGYTWGMELAPELLRPETLSAILCGQMARFAVDLTFVKDELGKALSRPIQ